MQGDKTDDENDRTHPCCIRQPMPDQFVPAHFLFPLLLVACQLLLARIGDELLKFGEFVAADSLGAQHAQHKMFERTVEDLVEKLRRDLVTAAERPIDEGAADASMRHDFLGVYNAKLRLLHSRVRTVNNRWHVASRSRLQFVAGEQLSSGRDWSRRTSASDIRERMVVRRRS